MRKLFIVFLSFTLCIVFVSSTSYVWADVQLAPDGTYVDGDPQLAPDVSSYSLLSEIFSILF